MKNILPHELRALWDLADAEYLFSTHVVLTVFFQLGKTSSNTLGLSSFVDVVVVLEFLAKEKMAFCSAVEKSAPLRSHGCV